MKCRFCQQLLPANEYAAYGECCENCFAAHSQGLTLWRPVLDGVGLGRQFRDALRAIAASAAPPEGFK